MSYSVVLGDLGPIMTLNISADGFTLDEATDTVVLRYEDPDGTIREVDVDIEDDVSGDCSVTWVDGDLPAVGPYVGLVVVTRVVASVPDPTFPRSFPNDGTKVVWWVNGTI